MVLGNPLLSQEKTSFGSSPTSVPTMDDIERFIQQTPLHMMGRYGESDGLPIHDAGYLA